MSDFFTDEQIATLSATTVQCTFVVKFAFASSTIYAWNGNYSLTIGANTYQPMYGMGAIDGLGYSADGSSESVTLTLSGLPEQDGTDFLAAALDGTDEVSQRVVTISLALFDDDWQPVGAPLPLFYGFMQPPKVTRTPATQTEGSVQTITVAAENIFFNRAKPPYGRNNDRDQQARSPGDKIFGFVASLVNKTVTYPDY
jgi:hypothetical protein